jgi:hypothetical protein
LIRQGKADRAMSKAMQGAGGEVIDWSKKTGIPAVKKGYADVQDWSYKNLHDPKKHKKGEHMAYMQQQRNDAHDAMVKKHGPDYREKQLKKMGSDVYDATTSGLEYVGNEISSIGGLASDFAGSAYDAVTSDPANLANLDIDNSTKTRAIKKPTPDNSTKTRAIKKKAPKKDGWT